MHQLKESVLRSAQLPSTAETSSHNNHLFWYLCKYNNVCNNDKNCKEGSRLYIMHGWVWFPVWYQTISIAALLTSVCMDQKSNFQSLISFTNYLRDTRKEISFSNHLPQGLIPKALSLFTVCCYRPRIKTAILFRIIIITNSQSGENVGVSRPKFIQSSDVYRVS